MYILNKAWRDDCLDYHMSAQEVRVSIRAYWPLRQLTDLYFEQPRSLLRLWNHIRVVGPVMLVRKIRARVAERLRDSRFLAIGLGTIQDAGGGVQKIQCGQAVAFLAPCHPRCLERIVLPPQLVAPASRELMERWMRADSLLLLEDRPSKAMDSQLLSVAGWSPFSGSELASTEPLLERVRQMLAAADPRKARALPLGAAGAVREVSASPDMRPGLNAVVFGLGNYAKTMLLPNIDRRIHVACIHEIEPTQIDRRNRARYVFDTAATPRSQEKYDVYFIAGYHHTHGPLAVHALKQGAWAVIEKPLVTTHEQLDQLIQTMREHPGRVFAGFFKRYQLSTGTGPPGPPRIQGPTGQFQAVSSLRCPCPDGTGIDGPTPAPG